METSGVTQIWTSGCHESDCGGRCLLKLHVKNGVVIRVETDDGEEPQLRACARGRASRQKVYHPDRLKQPMRRVGARGEGKFEPISWDEALDTVASELIRVKGTYGPAAIFGMGHHHPGVFHNPNLMYRLLNMFGGCTTWWSIGSAEGSIFASGVTYGTLYTGHTQDDYVNSRLIIMWGWNPANSINSTNTPFYLAKAREAGAKIVCVDPRFTDSVATLADQWIFIRPGTDSAMMVAMAYVIIERNLQDQRFLDTYTLGFDRFRDYVMGIEDGLPKTPTWAEPITGVPNVVIENLALEYATSKPAALIAGWAPGRTAYGEQYHRAAITLAALTGNVGIHGGSAAGLGGGPTGMLAGPTIPTEENPVEAGAPPLFPGLCLDSAVWNRTRVHICRMWDAILEGKAGGYPSDIKLLYITNSNCLNQVPNTNKAVQALKKLEFIIVHEQFMTPTAKFADILLPVNTIWERNDMARPWLSGPYYLSANKAIDTLYGSKSDFDIFCELAPRLGFANYSDKTEEEWLRELFKVAPDMSRDISDYETFRKNGVHKLKLTEPQLCFKEQVEDPEHHSFSTPSGKIEIYSQRLAELNNPGLPPIPKYIETWESINDALAKKYPLQLITIHFKTRAHSAFDNVPWLKQLETQTVWINTLDAEARGISNGDEVKVFNERGTVLLPAKVTERIMPGVVAIGEGAWYRPDKTGADRGGCANVLTKDDYSPGGAWPSNTSLVQVQKV